MQCVWWLSLGFLLGVCGSAVDGQDWKLTDCDCPNSWDQIKDCMWQCRLKQLLSSAESLLTNLHQRDEEGEDEEQMDKEDEGNGPSLGFLFSALSQPDVSSEQLPSVRPQRSGNRPTYSMEHFRWGKPMSRKRRPVKVPAFVTADGEDSMERPMETSSPSLARRQLQEEQKKNENTKNTTKYRINHFRWNAPSATKRYAGFMKSLSEKSHNPLLALLRNIIAKNTQ